MNVLPLSSKSAALLLAGCLVAGTSCAQAAVSHAPTFDGTWSGTFSSAAVSQGCTYNVNNAVINVSKKTIQWIATRASCSDLACKYCPTPENFSNHIKVSGHKITFSVSKGNNPQTLVTGNLDKGGYHIDGKGNMKNQGAGYDLRLSRVIKPPHGG